MNAEIVTMTAPLGKLAGVCKTPEDILVYVARVSNPANQENVETGARLLRYCIEHKHWSIFETVNVGVEVETSRAMAAQILRHNSFRFQEFSQRYAVVKNGHEPIELRIKGDTNRQGSLPMSENHPAYSLYENMEAHLRQGEALYKEMIASGVAPESARFILPLATTTTLYMTGNVRSWIFYLAQRCDAHAQKEHREMALLIRAALAAHFPVLAEALDWPV